jgi:hypothetical protein
MTKSFVTLKADPPTVASGGGFRALFGPTVLEPVGAEFIASNGGGRGVR